MLLIVVYCLSKKTGRQPPIKHCRVDESNKISPDLIRLLRKDNRRTVISIDEDVLGNCELKVEDADTVLQVVVESIIADDAWGFVDGVSTDL